MHPDHRAAIGSGLPTGRLKARNPIMGMRPSDKDIEREIREEKYYETAYRALAVEAVTKWNR